LSSRRDTMLRPHHMIKRSGPDVAQRLLQTSLYRSDLDLLILDRDDNHAAYGLFWYDPETATGLVEPMRTEDDHQRRGLGRHLLTAGIDLLASAGAVRIKIGFSPDNRQRGVSTSASASNPSGRPQSSLAETVPDLRRGIRQGSGQCPTAYRAKSRLEPAKARVSSRRSRPGGRVSNARTPSPTTPAPIMKWSSSIKPAASRSFQRR